MSPGGSLARLSYIDTLPGYAILSELLVVHFGGQVEDYAGDGMGRS